MKTIYAIVCFTLLLLGSGCQRDTQNITNPDVRAEWREWVRNHHHPVRSLEADDTDWSDLQFLKTLLAGRRLVQLGESGHGVSEFNQAKVRLIKFLHEQMGFAVIAFESSIYECYMADQEAGKLTPEDMMGRSIFGVWHCEEVLELFRYIQETKKTARPLTLAGFDVQLSSYYGALTRPAMLKRVVARLDPAYAEIVFNQDKTFLANESDQSWIDANGESFKLFFQELTDWFDDHLPALTAFDPAHPTLPLLLRQTAWSMGPYIDELLSYYSNQTQSLNYRDRGMADNIGFLLEQLYPDKNIIAWAHNFHIEHDASEIPDHREIWNMGYWLEQRFRPILYTIGFYMAQGQSANNRREVYDVIPMADDSLEAILFQTGEDFAMVDIRQQAPVPGNSWMREPITTLEWGIYRYPLTMTRQYDALFYVKTTHAPSYLSYYGIPRLEPLAPDAGSLRQ